MSWNPDAPNPCVPARWQAECRRYVCYPFSNKCRSGCPYCFAGATVTGWPRDWTYGQALAAWQNVLDTHGPCSLSLGGAEPLDELPFVGELLRLHPAVAQTNLMFDEEELYRLVNPERLLLHPSFHPHLWGPLPQAEAFFGKLKRLQQHGYEVVLTALIGWPPYLPYWDEWTARLRDMGIWANCVPARLTKYQGRVLPDEYKEEELAVLARHCGAAIYTPDAQLQPLRIKACAAGCATVCVMPNGDVTRCGEYPLDMDGRNLYRDGNLTFADGPEPCVQKVCGCGNLYPYHITEATP
jgi:hypothetical protein